MAKKKKTVTMSVPEGLEFNTSYTLADMHMQERHNKHYWDTDRNLDPWRVPADTNFSWHLDKVTEKITTLLKEKNAAYGNSALNPLNVFSKLDAVESLLVRMDDKIARIKNKGITDKTEDTVDDLIGYLLLLKMAIERKERG